LRRKKLLFKFFFKIQVVDAQSNGYYSYLRCWRCDYDDPDQCVKNFDFTKHKHEPCDGKCLKAFEKVEARTKVEIDKAQSNFFNSKTSKK
jgi:hypothetical protein